MDIKLPNLGEGADSGTVVNVLVKEGDTVELNQSLIELENEKAVASIPSTAAGVVSRVYVKTGDKISVGARLVAIGDAGGAAPVAPATEPAEASKAPAKSATAKPGAETPEPEHAPDTEPEAPSGGPVVAAPSLRKLAADLGIDLSRIRGTAPGGRIVLADIRAYIQKLIRSAKAPTPVAPAPAAPAAKPAAEKIDFSIWGGISKKPMSTLRKVISRRMVENWNAIPHVTQFDNADLGVVMELRKKYAAAYEQKGARLTVTTFVLKALLATLKQHPVFNTSLDEAAEEIVFKEYYNIGIAVDTEAGLIVPVIRDADKKSLVELSTELELLAKKARDRKVSAEDLKGGTFTISNQGGIGGGHFTPIVNKPEVAILALGKGSMQAVVRNNVIEPRMMLPIAVSYDHRVIDGGAAARFTVDLVRAVENFNEQDVKI